MRHIFYAKVEGGELKIVRKNDYKEAIDSFEGQQVQITIEKKKKTRSLSQNAYYFGVVIPMIQAGLKEQGMKMLKDEVNELLKSKFLQREIVNENDGEIFKYVAGSSELSTSEFMDYIAEIQQFAAEYLNINIPSPGEQLTAEL